MSVISDSMGPIVPNDAHLMVRPPRRNAHRRCHHAHRGHLLGRSRTPSRGVVMALSPTYSARRAVRMHLGRAVRADCAGGRGHRPRTPGGAASGRREDATVSENITRSEAAARAELLEVHSYVIALDLREVESDATFVSTSTVRFAARQPGASTWIDLIAEEVLSAELNGRAAGRRRATTGHGWRWPDLAAENELVVTRPLPVHEHRRGPAPLGGPDRWADLPLHAVRRRGRAPGVRLLRAARPQGPLHLGRDRPGGVAGGLQQPHARLRGRSEPGLARWVFAADASAAHLPGRPVRRAVPRRALGVRRPARHLSAGAVRPGLDGRAPRCRGDPRDHPRRAGALRARVRRCPTPSASTTRCSSRSSTSVRWRTRGWSPSARTPTCTAPGSPRPPASRGPW